MRCPAWAWHQPAILTFSVALQYQSVTSPVTSAIVIGMRLGALSAFVSLAMCGSTLAAIAQQPTPADLVDALNGVFGKHAGDRAAHTLRTANQLTSQVHRTL